jgi:RNA polymerase sigma-70 factor (ECF subfamily)
MQNNLVLDFSLIYNRYKKGLYNYVLVITKSHLITEDIIHNVFLKLYDKFSTIKEPDKIDRWLFSTARNEALGYFRTTKIRSEVALDLSESMPAISNPYTELVDKEIYCSIEIELNLMEPGQSEVFRLKELSGMSYSDIAKTLAISEDLVKSRLYKARQKLKNALKHLL